MGEKYYVGVHYSTLRCCHVAEEVERRRWSFRLGNKWIRGGRRRRKGRKRRKCSFVVRLSEMFIWIAPFYLDSIPSLLFQLSAGVASAASAAFVSSWTSFLFCFVIFFKIDFTSSFSIVEETEWRTLSVSPSNETQPTLNYVNDVERMLDPSIDLHSKHSANCPWMWFHEQFQQFAIQTRWNPNEIGWNQLESVEISWNWNRCLPSRQWDSSPFWSGVETLCLTSPLTRFNSCLFFVFVWPCRIGRRDSWGGPHSGKSTRSKTAQTWRFIWSLPWCDSSRGR